MAHLIVSGILGRKTEGKKLNKEQIDSIQSNFDK